MKVRLIVPLVMVLSLIAVGPASAVSSSVGIYFDANGTTCSKTVSSPSSFYMYVIAHCVVDAAKDGITGAEFRILGLPEYDPINDVEWAYAVQMAAPLVLPTIIGDPFDRLSAPSAGGNVAYSECQIPNVTTKNVLLIRYRMYPPDPGYLNGFRLRVVPRNPPTNPNFNCVALILCDSPLFTMICVRGQEALVNMGPCTVGVTPTSWTAVKSLYN